jgi:ABC-2 type transport system ATP-binding protein
MSQKVQIASVLLSDPEICVLDEPTTGLDPVNVRLVQDLLIERRGRGRTTILSTHHMNQVEALCDRVALINRGRLIVYGMVNEVRQRYSLPEVIVRAANGVPMPSVPQVTGVDSSADGRLRLRLADGATPSDALTALVAAGAHIDSFEPALAPMEDIFLRVVREEAHA